MCPDSTVHHPCATESSDGDFDSLPGTISLNVSIVSDYSPEEIAFLLYHVDTKTDIVFSAYDTYSYYEHIFPLPYGEDFVIRTLLS